MTSLLKAEFRKLFTIRSTYVLAGIATLLLGFIAFWAIGYKGEGGPDMFRQAIDASTLVCIFIAIIAILLITHEYRYNTIMYTLTASNSRSRVLLAKVIAIVSFAFAFAVFAAAFAVLLAWIGASIRGLDIVTQVFPVWDIVWRTLFYIISYVLAGLLFGVLFRHVVGALVTFLIVPSTIEGFATLLLKDNTKYLPFTALEQVQTGAQLSPPKAALIFGTYLVVGWVIAWILFLRRDAN